MTHSAREWCTVALVSYPALPLRHARPPTFPAGAAVPPTLRIDFSMDPATAEAVARAHAPLCGYLASVGERPAGLPTPNVTITPQIDPRTAAVIEGLRADAAIAAAAARQIAAQAPSAAQSASTAATGISQVGQAAPGIAQGANRIGQGIQSTSSSIEHAADTVLVAQQRTERFVKLAAISVMGVGLAVALASVVFASPAKHNGRRRRRR